MHRTLAPCALLLAALSPLTAQTVTLTSSEVLRIHFRIPSPPSGPPDVLQYGLGLVTVNSPYTTRVSRLWDCDTLMGTAVSGSFGAHVGALSLGVCNSWRQVGSVWNFDNPGDVASFAPIQTATIRGIIDFELASGSITLNLSNVTMMLVRATSASGGSVGSPAPVISEVVVVPKLLGPAPGTVNATNTWTTTGSPPGSLVVHAFGFVCSPALVPVSPPVFFDLMPPVVTLLAFADPSGQSTSSFFVPTSASGITLLTQCVELGGSGVRVSNFARHTFP